MPPVLETFRVVPVLKEKIVPMEVDSGYPFERNPDEGFRTQLDDIAKRHPELAEHLTSFTQHDRRQRRHSPDTASTFPRRFPRHFSDRFERFGFPFDREEFEPEQEQKKEQEEPREEKKETEEIHPQRERVNIQQSNTIDLGQKQEPINDRGKRSSSAPPTEKAPQGTEANVNRPSMAQPNQKTSNERIIPIHIEGRDEPVVPRNASTSTAAAPTAPPQQHSERIFGQRPEQFTQFLNREPRFPSNNWHSGFEHPEDHRQQPRFSNQQEEIPIPVQREVPMQKKQQQQQQSHQQQPQQQRQPSSSTQQPHQPKPQQRATSPKPELPKPAPSTPLDQIQAIQKDVSKLITQVEAFQGKPKDKQYLYLDEMLTRNLIKLDNIDTQGQETIRNARKEAIKCIERTISILESKAAAMAAAASSSESQEPMETQPAVPVEPAAPVEQSAPVNPSTIVERAAPVEMTQPMEIVVPENCAEVTEEPKSEAEQPPVDEQESNTSVDETPKKFGSVPLENETEQKTEAEVDVKKEDKEGPKEEDKIEDSSLVETKNKEKKKGKKKIDKNDK